MWKEIDSQWDRIVGLLNHKGPETVNTAILAKTLRQEAVLLAILMDVWIETGDEFLESLIMGDENGNTNYRTDSVGVGS
jgi:hypothetical protein